MSPGLEGAARDRQENVLEARTQDLLLNCAWRLRDREILTPEVLARGLIWGAAFWSAYPEGASETLTEV